MLETRELTDTHLELMLHLQPEESMEWQAQFDRRHTGWHDVQSSSQLAGLTGAIANDGDWLTVQTKGLDLHESGRYAQAMNTGSGYQLEVAQVGGGITHNWRIGLGSAADDDGNLPYSRPARSQTLTLAAVVEVLVSWLQGRGLPLGYGAALRVYA